MTQEKKDLLLKDLCARLPYRVRCQCDNIKTQGVLKEIGINYNMCRLYDSFTDEYENCYIFDCKPYLFPLSSITYEKIYDFYCRFIENECDFDDFKEFYLDNGMWHKLLTSLDDTEAIIDWFHKNHFDYRGLIPMGLANDATDKNIY